VILPVEGDQADKLANPDRINDLSSADAARGPAVDRVDMAHYARTSVIRLTGLPSLSRCPDVSVGRADGRIEIRFSGPGQAEVAMDVEDRYLGGEDPEAAQLRLLARLAEMGYRATRAPGPGESA
jgi:hypothetical protein